MPPSLAKGRGEGWAAPHLTVGAIAVSRPIIVECHDDRLVVLPERKTIPLDTHTADVVDQLVHIVHDHMHGWGVAGDGLYWKPELVCRVYPNGTIRYAELKSLLDGSGLDVRQAQKR
jgi:hypothetical protein